MVETRDVTWEARSVVEVPPPQLRLLSSSELERASELEGTPEPGGLDGFDSAQPTPSPLVGRGIPQQLRAASPTASEGLDDQGERDSAGDDSLPTLDGVNAPSSRYLSLASRESSVSVNLSVEESETPSSDEDTPASTMARTAACQLEPHLPRPVDGGDLRKGRTSAQTIALNQEATGLTGMFRPDEGGKLIHGLLAVQEITRESGELSKCLVRENGAETSFVFSGMLGAVLGRVDGGDGKGV